MIVARLQNSSQQRQLLAYLVFVATSIPFSWALAELLSQSKRKADSVGRQSGDLVEGGEGLLIVEELIAWSRKDGSLETVHLR